MGFETETNNNSGFTLIELLVVISIIGLLSVTVLVSLASAREKARIAVGIADIQQLQTAARLYYNDTGRYPATCNRSCTQATDPFLNSLGVSGWRGPYLVLYSQHTPWGGHLNFYNDTHGPIISFDDDAPGASGSDNSGPVPQSSMQAIDQQLDDGNLSKGKIQTYLSPECDAEGELCYEIPKE